LYYNRARYYSPDLGRFINRDPIDVADDVNLYAYVGNNSIMYIDPNGEAKDLLIKSFYEQFQILKKSTKLAFDLTWITTLQEWIWYSAAFWVWYIKWDQNLMNEWALWLDSIKTEVYFLAGWYGIGKTLQWLNRLYKSFKLSSYSMKMPISPWTELKINKSWFSSKLTIWWKKTWMFDFVLINWKIKIWYWHSFLASWKNVNYAGMVNLENWIIKSWSNMSWHYIPNFNDKIWMWFTKDVFYKMFWVRLTNFNPIKFK